MQEPCSACMLALFSYNDVTMIYQNIASCYPHDHLVAYSCLKVALGSPPRNLRWCLSSSCGM